MSALEDPAVTIQRLLRKNMRVVLDNGALAAVDVLSEYPNNNALRTGNAQVTVGLIESSYQKLDLSGKIRQLTSTLRVNAWAADMPAATESGRSLRNKLASEINRIIFENRLNPNVTSYNFLGLSAGSKTCRAFSGDSEAVPNGTWTELSSTDYQALWYSDDSRIQLSKTRNGAYSVLLMGFKIESRRESVQKLTLTFEGYGTSPAGNGVTIKVWNNTQSAWQNAHSHNGDERDYNLSITLATNQADFVDEAGYVWLLARTSHPSDGSTACTLFCDYVSCTATVNGITYCDVASSRNLDRVDIKPPIYRTEFTVKTQLIQNNGV
jgi:hypothetical protein